MHPSCCSRGEQDQSSRGFGVRWAHRRRAQALPRFRGEKECLKLVLATLWRASERWGKGEFTKLEREELEQYIKARRADGFEVRHLEPAAWLRPPSLQQD